MAAKKRKDIYFIDTASLSVRKIQKSFRQKFLRLLAYLIVAVGCFGVALLVSFYFFDSPNEKRLRRELSATQRQYKQLNKRLDKLNNVLEDIQQRDQNLYRMIFEAEPPKAAPSVYGNYDDFKDYSTADLVVSTSVRVDQLANELYAQTKSFDQVYKMAKNKTAMLQAMPAIFPVSKQVSTIASGFGMRLHPVFRSLRMHTGMDISAPNGSPVYATGDAVVSESGTSSHMSGYGVYVELNHGFSYKTIYAHLSKVAVRPGQKVKRGDIIGYVGSTGRSTGSHLHYEVLLGGRYVNPVYYFFIDLSPEEYTKVLEKSKEVNQSLS